MINNTRIFYSSIVTERERERDFLRCVWLWSLPRSHLKYMLIHSASKMSRSLPWTSFHKRGGKANSCEQIEWRGEFVKSTSVLTLQCGNSATIWTDESKQRNNTFRTVKIYHKGLSCFFAPELVFISQPEHCYLSSGYWTNFQPLPTIFCQKWGEARSMKSKESVCKSLT